MNKKFAHRYLLPALVCGLVIIGLLYYYFMSDLSASDKTQYVCIDRDDNVDSVFAKLTPISNAHALTGYKTLVRHSGYADHVRTGRYAIEPGDGALTVFRHLKNGIQTPVNLTIPSVRTLDRLARFRAVDSSAELAVARLHRKRKRGHCDILGEERLLVGAELIVPSSEEDVVSAR